MVNNKETAPGVVQRPEQFLRQPEFRLSELKSELARKGLHVLIAIVPSLAALNLSHTVMLVMLGMLFYLCLESLRFLGFSLPFISSLTEAALRKRERGRFALAPVTLGLGALLATLLFPPRIAAAAVYAVAFGDSIATLTGKFLGRLRPAFLGGKSIEGSLACFAAAALPGFLVLRDVKSALVLGVAAVIVDALPLGDFDNLLLPLAAGLAVYLC